MTYHPNHKTLNSPMIYEAGIRFHSIPEKIEILKRGDLCVSFHNGVVGRAQASEERISSTHHGHPFLFVASV